MKKKIIIKRKEKKEQKVGPKAIGNIRERNERAKVDSLEEISGEEEDIMEKKGEDTEEEKKKREKRRKKKSFIEKMAQRCDCGKRKAKEITLLAKKKELAKNIIRINQMAKKAKIDEEATIAIRKLNDDFCVAKSIKLMELEKEMKENLLNTEKELKKIIIKNEG